MIDLNLYLAMIADDSLERNFEELYHQYSKLMLYRAYEMTQNKELSEDLVHEAFIKVAKNMHMVMQCMPNRRKALLMRILENTVIDDMRKHGREKSYTVVPEERELIDIRADEQGADGKLVYAVLKMPLRYQQIFYLKYAHGYNNREIAQLLGITVSSIEKTLSRGKKTLVQRLNEEA